MSIKVKGFFQDIGGASRVVKLVNAGVALDLVIDLLHLPRA